MASPTSLTVTVDLEEYSKFEIEEARSVITATIVASGGGDMSGEQITVELTKSRRGRDSVVRTNTATISGTSDPATVSSTIDLNLVVDSDYINLIRRGRYFIKVTSVSDDSVSAITSDFYVNPVTALQLRNTYLFGLKMDAFEMRDVRYQPTQITGVEVVTVSGNHPIGFDVLTYRYDSSTGIRHISWGNGGPITQISSAGMYLLRSACSSNYIEIKVSDLTNLPTSSEAEELYIQKSEITDTKLRRWLNQACDWLENDKIAHVFLEPTRVVTDPLDSTGTEIDWDFIVPRIQFDPCPSGQWINIKFPYANLLRIDELFGQMANTRILNVDTSWVEITERNGFVRLVPFNRQAGFEFIGLVWVESLRGRIELPNFWHFNALAGLRQVDPVLLEMIGKKAAIDALIVAGHALRGGYASQSISRDGVSESVSYTASAIYGIYSATIEDYTKFINKEIKQLRGRYRGPGMVVL